MSQTEKAFYFQQLKAAGVTFDKHYREYTTEGLKEAYEKLEGVELQTPPVPEPKPAPEPRPTPPPADVPPAAADRAPVPRRSADPGEMPSQRLNSKPEEEPIRVDENGLIWYQEEVLKPAFPKPRGRRVLKYLETGTTTESVQNGDYVETFEVAGRGTGRPAEVKITLPSYQVGIYKDPRFPFRIHTYNGTRGFDFFEVQNYYGGSELVPAEIKRIYVENVLCYDIRTVVRAIQSEFRQLQLAGKVQ